MNETIRASVSRHRNRKPHRNITFQRLLADFVQGIRSIRRIRHIWGSPWNVSRDYLEIDITYRCNLACANCNRSCAQAPRSTDISIEQIEQLITESLLQGYQWRRIRLLGGEPTLHPRFLEIIQLLRIYRDTHLPSLRIVVCTNGYGPKVRQMLDLLPEDIEIKSTEKSGGSRLFRPFNKAPCDSRLHRFYDYETGCRILSECGMGLTPMGYYPCAISGGIDDIVQVRIGRKRLPDPSDSMKDILKTLCPLCGHFAFQWPVRTPHLSKRWKVAYSNWRHRLSTTEADTAYTSHENRLAI